MRDDGVTATPADVADGGAGRARTLAHVVDRRDVGGWLDGTSSVEDDTYAGERLGLPQHGPGSLATLGRRVLALLVDWLACSLIAAALCGYSWGATGGQSFAPLAVFLVENVLLISTLGSTFGHRLLGLAVQREGGGSAPGPLPALIRSALLCLVIPAVVWDRDQRGLHDRLARTVLVSLR